MMKLRHLTTRRLFNWFKHEPAQQSPSGASTGQVLIMFALFLTGLIGMLGMATDLGYAFSQRRSSQNAADAAALAGARKVVKQQAAWSDANAAATSNQMNNTTITMSSCTYVDQGSDGSITDLGSSCSGLPSANADGVRAEVTETHNTFFMRIMPGTTLDSVTVTTDATANVQELLNPPGNGPFMLCGVDTELSANGNNSADLIIPDGGGWKLNPAADGLSFLIHGPQIERCGLNSSDWKGISWQDKNEGADLNNYWGGDNGTQAGPVRENVRGPSGCDMGALGGCVMILPIAENSPHPAVKDLDGASDKIGLYVVAYGAFFVTQISSNEHAGVFMYDYSLKGPGTPGSWTPGSTDLITIRLTE